jgi:uncharacterized protein YigE (DUF2233 family)
MRPWFLLILLSGCAAEPSAERSQSPCAERSFEGASLIMCVAEGPVEIRSGHRRFAALGAALGDRANAVAFAMNAGMFDAAGKPIGLMIENGRAVHAINRREGGGNFHLMPNGVFLVRRDGTAAVVTSERLPPAKDIAFATQSGPMLLIDGKLHPKFDADGTSKYVRNAVGIAPDGTPVFVISQSVVSFGKLARFFRDELKVRDALYLDGSVSSLWDPANGRLDDFTELGPMVVAFRPSAVSGPGPSSPATP